MKKGFWKQYAPFLKTRLYKNLTWVFWGNFLHSLLNFILSIYVARLLPLDSNGTLTYASSLVSLFTCFTGLGYGGIITREFSENEEDSGKIICSCLVSRICVSLVAIAIMMAYVYIVDPDNRLLHIVVLCHSIAMLIGSSDLFVFWLRFKNQANVTAVYRLIAFFVCAVLKVVMLSVFGSLYGYVAVSIAESIIFTVLLMIFYFRNYGGKFSFSLYYVRKMLKSSYPFIFTAIMTTIYARTDTVMLNNMVSPASVALYGVSVRLAGFTSTIPTTIIEAFRPDIMDAKLNDEHRYKNLFRILYAIIFWTSIAYSLFCTIFAKQIILLLYSEKYIEATQSLALVVWYSAFSYLGAVNSMYMVAEKKAKWVQLTSLSGAITNVIVNYFLIPIWGIMGAALASFLTQFGSNFVVYSLIKPVRGGFRLMIEGIMLKGVLPAKEKTA